MNRLTDDQIAALDRYAQWQADAEAGHAEAASAVSDSVLCGPLNDDHHDQVGRMEGFIVAIGLAVAVLGTIAIIHFAARYFA